MSARRLMAVFLPLVLVAVSLMVPASSHAQKRPPFDPHPLRRSNGPAYAPGQVLVRLRDEARFGTQAREVGRALQSRFAWLAVRQALRIAPATYRLELPANADVLSAVQRLQADPAIVYAQPNYWRRAHRSVNDPLSPFQYALTKLDAFNAWNFTTGSPTVKIAILDTGVAPNHPDLEGRVLPGYNFVSNNADAGDDEGHGTHTAGIAAATGDNGEGIAGMCWQCRILPVKVLNDAGEGLDEWIAQGVRWAADNGARVINLSLGGSDDNPILHEAIRYAASKNVLVVASAGNSADQGNPVQYPAAYDEVLAVGATDENDRRAFFSQVQGYVDVSAPGWNIPSTFDPAAAGLRYVAFSGTSEAAPFVSGLAGLLLSLNPDLDVNALRQLIQGTADDLGVPGPDPEYGAGRINAARAVAAVRRPGFDAVPNPQQPDVLFFPETGHTLRGAFRRFWEQNGGLAVFGFPISEEIQETTAEGTFLVQYFERNRFELHPEQAPPYNVLLGRLGDTQLQSQGRNWFTLPKGQPTPGCQFFIETGHTLCEPFLSYWRNHGLLDPALSSYGRSLALFGFPLSEPQVERNASGDLVLTQWFERARFEFHPNNPPEYQVLLGLLGNELIRPGIFGPRPSNQAPAQRCGPLPPAIAGTIRPGDCLIVGTWVALNASGFAPGEVVSFSIADEQGESFELDPLRADEQGRIVDLQGTVVLPPGQYALVFRGVQSGHQAVIYLRMIDR